MPIENVTPNRKSDPSEFENFLSPNYSNFAVEYD